MSNTEQKKLEVAEDGSVITLETQNDKSVVVSIKYAGGHKACLPAPSGVSLEEMDAGMRRVFDCVNFLSSHPNLEEVEVVSKEWKAEFDNRGKQLSAVAKALNWQAPYQAPLSARAEAVIQMRDSLNEQLKELSTINADLLSALGRIAKYPSTRADEMSTTDLRIIAREAITRATNQ